MAFAVQAEVIENVAARVQIDESARQKVVALPRAGTADDRRNLELKSNNREKQRDAPHHDADDRGPALK
jgi:hypothetical protein